MYMAKFSQNESFGYKYTKKWRNEYFSKLKVRYTMKKYIIKKFAGLLVCGIVLSIFCLGLTSVQAAYKNCHNGTYEMKKGLYYKNQLKITKGLEIDVNPTSYYHGTPGVNMYIYTAYKNFLGNWSADKEIGKGPSTDKFSVYWKEKGTIDGVFFDNPTDVYTWKGNFDLYWE